MAMLRALESKLEWGNTDSTSPLNNPSFISYARIHYVYTTRVYAMITGMHHIYDISIHVYTICKLCVCTEYVRSAFNIGMQYMYAICNICVQYMQAMHILKVQCTHSDTCTQHMYILWANNSYEQHCYITYVVTQHTRGSLNEYHIQICQINAVACTRNGCVPALSVSNQST
jgi:hypothetical protein